MSEEDFRLQVCKRIRQFRKEKGISQLQMARACGIGRPTYNMKESGKFKFSAYEVAQIAKTMGVFVDYLFGTGGWR